MDMPTAVTLTLVFAVVFHAVTTAGRAVIRRMDHAATLRRLVGE